MSTSEAEDKPIALEAYEALAESYARAIDSKPENAYYEMPATLSLLPDVKGKRVLDAGCGPGQYAEWLVEHGAVVTAVDVSPRMVKLARKRLRGRAAVAQADLSGPLVFPDNSFDIVLCALVLDHIEDWGAAFRQFHRVLSDGGVLVFSVLHPWPEFAKRGETSSYFELELIVGTWSSLGVTVSMPTYRRSLEAMFSALYEEGFRLLRLIEPRPTEEYKAVDPEGYEDLSKRPGFLCISAVKEGGSDD